MSSLLEDLEVKFLKCYSRRISYQLIFIYILLIRAVYLKVYRCYILMYANLKISNTHLKVLEIRSISIINKFSRGKHLF